jgi:hypothetical protein
LLVGELQKINFDFQRLREIFDYDVALSFAGEDRKYADHLARLLTNRKIRVFYDAHEESDLWGKNLIEHLEEIYGRQARFCVMFVSNSYAAKVWPTHERRAAQERALKDISKDYILPIRLDDTKIPGLPSSVAYASIDKGVDYIFELLIRKIQDDRARAVSLWSQKHSDRFG